MVAERHSSTLARLLAILHEQSSQVLTTGLPNTEFSFGFQWPRSWTAVRPRSGLRLRKDRFVGLLAESLQSFVQILKFRNLFHVGDLGVIFRPLLSIWFFSARIVSASLLSFSILDCEFSLRLDRVETADTFGFLASDIDPDKTINVP
jgi:hypothetical protein